MKKLCTLMILLLLAGISSAQEDSAVKLSLKTTNKITNDFDELDDVRNFTSESLFSASRIRLNRNLTEDELRGIIRTKDQFKSGSSLAISYGDFPTLELLYNYHSIQDAQITNFFEPNVFNNMYVTEYGVGIGKNFKLSSDKSFFIKGIFKEIERKGNIEFHPEETEYIHHFEINSVLSFPVYGNKTSLEFFYANQDIPDIETMKRYRNLRSAKIVYEIQSFPITAKGIEVFGGVARDTESYGEVDAKQSDYFIGISVKEARLIQNLNLFDIMLQSTIFNSEVDNDESQNNSQYRTNFNLLYRIVERLPFRVNLVFPFKYDIAITGTKNFENFSMGIQCNASYAYSKVTLVGGIRYDYEMFYRLDKDVNLLSFTAGFEF